jgi:hypothetical protein
MPKEYPKIFKSMDDVKFVIENFPKEVWEDDMQDLLSSNYGWIILGKNPKVKNWGIIADVLSVEEIKEICDHTEEWGGIVPFFEDDDSFGTFTYRGDTILCEAGEIPYANTHWLDQEYVLSHLYGFAEAQEKLQKQADEIKKQMKDITWVDDEGREVDENDKVITKMIDINADDPFEGLSAAELLRLSPILKAHTELICHGMMEKENDEEELR